MKSNTKWKEFLLKSGLPLEYEIQELLRQNKYWGQFEFSYVRRNENDILNEFSCDINASKHGAGAPYPNHFVQLLIECKYRHESTNWIFTPEDYHNEADIRPDSYLHSNSSFAKSNKFIFGSVFEEQFPACGKGIEVTNNGQNPKSIHQATKQLGYGMMIKVLEGMGNQMKYKDHRDTVQYTIPIIVTTANLYRLEKNVTIKHIKNAENIEDIAKKEDCIFLQSNIGEDLKKHNRGLVKEFIKNIGKTKLEERFNEIGSWTVEEWLNYHANEIPVGVLVINHSDKSQGFSQLFKTLDNVVLNPTKEIYDKLTVNLEELKKILEKEEE